MSDIATRGRRGTVLDLEYLGEVTLDDIAERQAGLPKHIAQSQTPSLSRIRGIHHELAKLLASGLTETEVAAATGYSLSRISILKNDSAFKSLLDYYTKAGQEAFVDIKKQLALLSSDILGEIQDRLEQKPESFSPGALAELAKLALDRSGFAPVTKSVAITASATDLAAIKAKAKESQNETVTILEQLPSGSGAD